MSSLKFSLTLECGNDAFRGNAYPEVIRLLREAADRMERRAQPAGVLLDINGNKVGSYALYRDGEYASVA